MTAFATAALAAFALALAGCGDGADQRNGAGRSAASSSFLAQGNAVLCDERHDLVGDALGQALGGHDPSPGEARDELLPAYRAIRDRLAGLRPPAADAAAFAAIVDDLGAGIARADREPALLLGDDDPFAAVERRMAAIGLDGCA